MPETDLEKGKIFHVIIKKLQVLHVFFAPSVSVRLQSEFLSCQLLTTMKDTRRCK